VRSRERRETSVKFSKTQAIMAASHCGCLSWGDSIINNNNDANNAVDEILNNDELDDNAKLQQLMSLKDSLSKMSTNTNINRNLLIRISRNIQVLQQKLQQKAIAEE